MRFRLCRVYRSKTDVYSDGAWVVIAKTFKHTCPYLLVQRYFVAASFSADSEEFIFRPLVFLRGTGAYKLRGSVPLSYTRARVLSAFDSIGFPKQDYGLHSLRAGGASAAAVSYTHLTLPTKRIV